MSAKTTNLRKNQHGLASILVTMILMLVISLIVLGLARLSRREQRQALDDQLSTQAFYAAESGVNDAIKEINSGTVDFTQDYHTNCNNFISALKAHSGNPSINTLNSGDGVEYTCLLVNPKPDNLQFTRIGQNNSTVAQLNADQVSDPGATINNLTISWHNADGGSDDSVCPASGTFPARGSWPGTCQSGILRIDLATTIGGSFNRSSLATGTLTLFLYPQSPGGGVTTYDTAPLYPVSPSNNGTIIPVKCDAAGVCKVTLNNIHSFASGAIRMKSVYNDSAVTITSDFAGHALRFTGGQIMIDATGKANDILRRIQVRIKATQDAVYPEFGIQSGNSICKRLQIAVGTGVASNAGPAGIDSCDILTP